MTPIAYAIAVCILIACVLAIVATLIDIRPPKNSDRDEDESK